MNGKPSFFMDTYTRLPPVFTRGQGAVLFDTEGKRYIDFTAGIAVNCLGHNYEPLVKAISEQAAKILHLSNYYKSEVSEAFAEKLVQTAGMTRVFLANSGAEANEGACKIARKYSLQKYGPGRHTIVTLQGSFHGRTITTLAATGQDKFHRDFGPFTEGFKHIPGGDLGALDAALDDTVAGLLIEVIQGESGVIPQAESFVQAAARLCAERDILFMCDEIQCGMGRTGTFLAVEAYGVAPDLVTLAKGLAGGVPCGAVLANAKTAQVLGPGDHGSTFGGNPLAAAAGLVVLDTISAPGFMQEIVRKGERLRSGILAWGHPEVKEVRGRGLMIGAPLHRPVRDVVEWAVKMGVLVLSAGDNALRFLPPYTISDAEIDEGIDTLKWCV